MSTLWLALVALNPESQLLDDGAELLVVELPGARETSLRYVVRSGSADDLPGQAGAAHLLEHVLFHGSYEVTEAELWASARKAGVELNAFTSADATMFSMNATNDQFEAFAETYLGVITAPALDLADVDREIGVIATERTFFSRSSLSWVVDGMLFPGETRGATIIGTHRSLRTVSSENLRAQYSRHYHPANTTIIVTGGASPERVRTLVARSIRLAPARPKEEPAEVTSPNVPIKEKIRAPTSLAMLGYVLARARPATCEALAALIDLRGTRLLHIDAPLASRLETTCLSARGNSILLAAAFSSAVESSSLPEALGRVFEGIAKKPMSTAESKVIKSRFERRLEILSSDPSELADVLMLAAAEDRPVGGRTRLDTIFSAPRVEGADLIEAALESFLPERSFLLFVSPFEGN
ncbi:MAG: insulinase family protein [Deltaproteobacteria bacterium]|nr:insulinase family protein [Deltaproteobacteria bacterium]